MSDAVQPPAAQTPAPSPAAPAAPAAAAPTTPPAAPAETAAAPATGAPTDWQAEAEKWKTLSRQNEAQAKANAEKAQRFDALEEANKTELQKAQDALAAANQRATEAEAARLRSDIARTKNVPVELLTASDETSLAAQAEALLAFRGEQPQTPPAPQSSGPTPSGAAPARVFKQSEINDLWATHKDEILRAQAEGRIDINS